MPYVAGWRLFVVLTVTSQFNQVLIFIVEGFYMAKILSLGLTGKYLLRGFLFDARSSS